MGVMAYSLLWVLQELYHQPYFEFLLGSLLSGCVCMLLKPDPRAHVELQKVFGCSQCSSTLIVLP